MTAIETIWIILQLIIGYNLILPVILFVSWLVFKHKNKPAGQHATYDYAIIVTAYEQTHALPAVVHSILNQEYTNYLVYIVADKCDTSDLKFEDERIIVLSPGQVLASNTKSHLYAMSHFKRAHNLVTIIDSDNLLDKHYLSQLNITFAAGFDAVQGVRAAKNLDTMYACLDAARDIYYHFYDGQILFGLGSSATLSGSGMAFKSSLYQEFLDNHKVQGAGFDKVLQYFIVKKGLRIAFNKDAVVYDEKTSKPAQLVQQRSRWINTWFKYFGFGFKLILTGISKFNLNQFLFGVILMRPPLFIFIILSLICTIASLLFNPVYFILWAGSILLFLLSFYIALIYAKPDRRIYKSLFGIPKFMFLQLKSLAGSRNANKKSVATQHYHH